MRVFIITLLLALAPVAGAQDQSRPVDATTVATQAQTDKIDDKVNINSKDIARNEQATYDSAHEDFIIKIVTAVFSFLTLLVTAIGVPIISAKLAAAKEARVQTDAKLDGVLSKHVAMAQAGGYFEGVNNATHPLVNDASITDRIVERGGQLTRAAENKTPLLPTEIKQEKMP